MNTELKDKKLSELTPDELEQHLAELKKESKVAAKRAQKEFERDRDEFIDKMINEFRTAHAELKSLKDRSVRHSIELHERMFKVHAKEPKKVNSFSLVNEAGDKKLVIDRQERSEFTEEANVAIQGIQEFFKTKFASRSKTIYNLLDTLLMKNRKGDYDPKLLAKLRQQVKAIDDPELNKNFELLESSQRVVGSATYVRAYKRDEQGKWQDIVLQFSAL